MSIAELSVQRWLERIGAGELRMNWGLTHRNMINHVMVRNNAL